jgi:uncharacterized protein YjdB
MKNTNKLFGFLALVIITGMFINGCAGFVIVPSSSVITIRTENNLSSIRLGGTLRFSASGRVIWVVSSTSDGTGPVAEGTVITENGVLTVSVYETVIIIYVIAISADSGESVYKQIRVSDVTGVTVSPSNQSVARGRTRQFNASVTGTNNPDNAVTWEVSSNIAGNGTVTSGTRIDGNGLLTVAANETLSVLYVRAASIVDPSKSGSVSVNVVIPTITSITVNPSNQSITRGRTLQFNASVMGTYDPDSTVTWRVSSNAAGTGTVTAGTTINANGLLTVSANETLTTLYVIATSRADTSKSGNVPVSVVIPTVAGVTVGPSNQSVTSGRTLQFNASVMGNYNPDSTVTWRVSSNAAGTGAVASGTGINANGLLTVSANETAATLYVFATSVADTSKFGSVSVSVIIPTVTGVSVSPSNQSITRGRTLQFNASVTGTNNPNNTVTWRVSSNAAGTGAVTPGTTINANGLLTVAANETATTLYVIATSVADASKSGNVSVSVIIPTVTGVSVSPSGQSITRGGTLQFNASVTGTNNPDNSVTWRVSSNAAGTGVVTSGTTINANGLLTVAANETATTLYVIATSVADTSKSGNISVSVIIPTVTGVSVSPSGQSITRGSTLQFNASITGTNNPDNSVTWRVSSNAAGTGAVTPRTTINANGLLTVAANETATTLYVIATSAADTSKSGSSAVTITRSASENQNDQGQNQNNQGQNQNSQGQNQNSQGQNQNSQGNQ